MADADSRQMKEETEMSTYENWTSFASYVFDEKVCGNDDIAQQCEDRLCSYADLARNARRVATGLQSAGIAPGNRVAVLAKNSERHAEILFGCACIGAVMVEINYRLAPAEMQFIAEDADAKILFAGDDFLAPAQTLLDNVPSLERGFSLDDSAKGAEFGESYSQWRDGQQELQQLPSASNKDAVLLQMYTSGTTGHPKGVELTQGTILILFDKTRQDSWYDFTPQDVNLVCMPMFHVAGLNWLMLGLFSYCRNVIHTDVDPAAILKSIEQDRITHAIFVPAVILFVVSMPQIGETDLSSMKQLTYGASPIPEDLLKQAMSIFSGCRFNQVYGLTETSGYATYMDHDAHIEKGKSNRLRSCGKPGCAAQIRIEGEDGSILPTGEIGEVVISGPMLMKGYYNRPQANAEAIRDGWFHSGDAGYFDEDGYLYIHDRLTDMIISGGENIYPAEVESVLFAHPQIADVAVVSKPSERMGESVHAVVVPAPGSQAPDLESLQSFAREKLAGFKIPRSMETMDMLPRNPSGKILRRVLRDKHWQGQERKVH